MTVLFVIATIALLLLLDAYLVRSRRRARALSRYTDVGQHVWFHPGHTWVRPHGAEPVRVGATDFAANFVGSVKSVELPREGAQLRAGDPVWTLVSRGGRRLRQLMPVDGEIVAVNHALERRPGLAQQSPYDEGWIVQVRPRDLLRSLEGLLSGEPARRFLDETLRKVNERLRPALGAVAQDGAEWAPAFGERLGDLQWETLRVDLFPEPKRSKQ